MHVIGLHGEIGSGKSEVAKFLVKNGFIRNSFADPIRRACASLFNFSEEQMTDRILKEQVDPEWGISPRDAFRLVGHGFRTSVCDDIWIKHARKAVGELYSKLFVFDDVRYQNELDFIEKEMEGTVVRIERPDNPHKVPSTHDSDTQQLSFGENTITIINDSGLEELQVKAMFMLKDVGVLDPNVFDEMVVKINARNSWRIGLWRC